MPHIVNQEAEVGRLPLLREERGRGVLHMLWLHLQYALSAWALLVGGYIATSVGATVGLVTLLAGSLFGAGLAAAGAMPCQRYGLDPADAAKPCLGTGGTQLLLVLFWMGHVVRAGLMLVMFGRGMQNFLGAAGVVQGTGIVCWMVLLGIVTTYASIIGGNDGWTRLRTLAMPSLLLVGTIVFCTVLHVIAWDDLVRIPPLTSHTDTRQRALGAFECALGVALSWWPHVARLSRQASSQRVGFYASWLALATAITAMGTAGLCAALVLRSWDPTQWLIFLGGRAVGALSLIVIMVTSLAAVGRIMHGASLVLQHAPTLRKQRWRRWIAVLFAPLLIFVAYPTALYERGDALFVMHGYVFAPILSVLLVDHLVLRRRRLNLTQVFETTPHSDYAFNRGFNARAWSSIVAGTAAAWWLYNPFTHVAHPWTRLGGATLPGALLAALIYGLLSLGYRNQRLGGYGNETATAALSPAEG